MRLIKNSERLVSIPEGTVFLEGALGVPEGARGVVLFAHGSGSSRHSPRNNFVARFLRDAGFATLLIDLLTRDEDMDYETRFDIPLLARRLRAATGWLLDQTETKNLRIGYFGASTGSAAALMASVMLDGEGDNIGAIVSRGGRPDLAMEALPEVTAPTLLIVGGLDGAVIEMNRTAFDMMKAEKELLIIPGATHLFEEQGALEQVAQNAARWFDKYLKQSAV